MFSLAHCRAQLLALAALTVEAGAGPSGGVSAVDLSVCLYTSSAEAFTPFPEVKAPVRRQVRPRHVDHRCCGRPVRSKPSRTCSQARSMAAGFPRPRPGDRQGQGASTAAITAARSCRLQQAQHPDVLLRPRASRPPPGVARRPRRAPAVTTPPAAGRNPLPRACPARAGPGSARARRSPAPCPSSGRAPRPPPTRRWKHALRIDGAGGAGALAIGRRRPSARSSRSAPSKRPSDNELMVTGSARRASSGYNGSGKKAARSAASNSAVRCRIAAPRHDAAPGLARLAGGRQGRVPRSIPQVTLGHRHQEVAADVADPVLHVPLLAALGPDMPEQKWAAKAKCDCRPEEFPGQAAAGTGR